MPNKTARLDVAAFPRTAPTIFRGRTVHVKAIRNEVGQKRVGVIVPAAAVPSAVRRHRIKRRLLALARTLPASPLDVLLLVRKEAEWTELQQEFATIESALQALSKKP